MYELETSAYFDSAHFLTDYYGKCENLHGHRWKITVTIQKQDLEQSGTEKAMVMDFGAFKSAVRELADSLDHRFLVEEGSLQESTLAALASEGFEVLILPFRTTAENIARYCFESLVEAGLPVSQVEVDETPNNRAIYRP